MSTNKNLHTAKKEKNDEFYTQYEDVREEVERYVDQLKDKIIYCNCDNEESNFYKYFYDNFDILGLKKLICSHYNPNGNSYKLEISRDINNDGMLNKLDTQKTTLKGNGDFRNDENIEILKEVDIVITNCPFSLFRVYINQLIEYDKKFLIIGHQNAITYKDVFKLIKDNKLWLGVSPSGMKFKQSDGSIRAVSACWFTNLIYNKQREDLILSKKYTPEEYPKYDNYDAINVDRVKDIPMDYDGCMGVPITYLFKHTPNYFEIVGSNRGIDQDVNKIYGRSTYINKKETFTRIFIKKNYNPNQFEIVTLGIVGTCDFTCNKKMEILDENGNPTGKFTYNAKGTLYRLYDPKTDKSPAFRNVETNELYTSIYARIVIKRKTNKNNSNENQ